jgi:prepilin-type N-terminal cleavage/methylation domain-containing protein
MRAPSVRARESLRLRDARGVTLTELAVTLALFGMVAAGIGGAWGTAQETYFVGAESAELQQNVRAAVDFIAREIRSAGRDATICAFDYATDGTTDCDGVKVARCASKLTGTGAPPWEADNGLGGAGCVGLHAIPFAEATADTLRIRSDRNHNGRIGGRGNAIVAPASAADRGEEDVLYALSTAGCPPGVSRCITRDDGTGPVAMVAVDIDGLTFTYFPRPNFGPCAGVVDPCDQPFPLPLASQAQADNIGRIRIAVQASGGGAGSAVSRRLVTDVTLRNRP